MATDTDILLRSRLDANQRDREQMCRALLALDPHYSDVRPRHPSGGPDGGRDIEAVVDGEVVAYGAVGFMNGANDSDEQKKQIRDKFTDDLKSALAAKTDLKAFVFMTNVHLTMGEQQAMREQAQRRGIERCDVLDRERLRIELDSPAGFFIRFQHLGVPLSEAEQASFLSRYGDRIQEVVSTGFQRIERALARQTFLLEASDVLDGVGVRFVLKEDYAAADIGHFRAFVHIALRALKHDILTIWFGSTDLPGRFDPEYGPHWRRYQPGIANGIASGQWEHQVRFPSDGASEEGDDEPGDRLTYVGGGSAVGVSSASAITARYSHDDPLFRFRPRLSLRDLDDCMMLPFLNLSLAGKLERIQVFANGYKLLDVGPGEFAIDRSAVTSGPPGYFSPEELADPWVRIRPSGVASNFHIRFSERTPRRMYATAEMPDGPPKAPAKDD